MALMGMLGGLGSAAGGIAGLFGNKNKNKPATAANQYLDQIPGAMNPYYQPYMDAGKGALGSLQGEYGSALNDPNAIYNKLAGGYKESPGYQFKLKSALGAGQNASASGGMLGTPQDVQQQEQIGHDISDQDFEKYMQHMSGIYNRGLEGEEGINKQGFDASTGYGNMLGSILGQKGKMAYEGANAANTAKGQNWSNIFSGLGSAATGYSSGDMMQQLFQKYMNGGA